MRNIKSFALAVVVAPATLFLALAPVSAGDPGGGAGDTGASADDKGVKAGHTGVSIKGNGHGTVEYADGKVSGTKTGTASHLGKYTLNFNGDAISSTTFGGNVTFQSANGDQLTGTYTSVLSASTDPETNETISTVDMDIEIDGGTGRFADASGELTYDCDLLHVDPGQTLYVSPDGTLQGQISR